MSGAANGGKKMRVIAEAIRLLEIYALLLKTFTTKSDAAIRRKEIKTAVVKLRGIVAIEPQARYKCPECEQVLDEGERRCDSCNKFGSRIDVLGTCPHCGEVVEEFE
jgi:predicted RNA-binding Zn-ribbon protein involved in translation (DUF1610 family)